MIDLIRELVQFLSRDSLRVEDVVAKVGPITNDPGGLLPIELEPNLPGVQAVDLARNPNDGLPYVLTMEIEDEVQPTVAALQTVFGDYERLLTHRGVPPEIIFYPPPSGSEWNVAIIATVESSEGSFENQQISTLSFRRGRLSS